MCIRDSSESHDGDENVDELHDHILGDHGSPLPVAGVPGAGLEPARLSAGDFKSPVSTSFTTRANWRRESESNRRPRLCRPLHDHSAIPPRLEKREGPVSARLGPSLSDLERETSLELATSTLARLRSTN